MCDAKQGAQATEGRRERKRRETRTRIAETAMALFMERGFSAVTVDEISEAVDISKPTFFNYFPSKEDVVLAWQDKFAVALTDALLARPAGEAMAQAIEEAMIAALVASATPESFAITRLIRETPALAARNQAKYANLEGALTEALLEREPDADPLDTRLLAMICVGGLRVGTGAWQAPDSATQAGDMENFSRRVFTVLWRALSRLSDRAPGTS